MWPAVQCFCAAAKEELGWGERGGREDTLCLFSPSLLCPALSNSVQLGRIYKKESILTLSMCSLSYSVVQSNIPSSLVQEEEEAISWWLVDRRQKQRGPSPPIGS